MSEDLKITINFIIFQDIKLDIILNWQKYFMTVNYLSRPFRVEKTR